LIQQWVELHYVPIVLGEVTLYDLTTAPST
jgi:hypothetical protein